MAAGGVRLVRRMFHFASMTQLKIHLALTMFQFRNALIATLSLVPQKRHVRQRAAFGVLQKSPMPPGALSQKMAYMGTLCLGRCKRQLKAGGKLHHCLFKSLVILYAFTFGWTA